MPTRLPFNRLLKPMVREGGELKEASWDDAVAKASELLKGKRVGIVFSPDWSIEGLTAIRLLQDVAFKDAKVAYELHRRDNRPFAFEAGLSMSTGAIQKSDQVLILGSDLRQRLPILMQRLRKRANQGKPITRIGAMHYRTNADLAVDALVRPRDWHAVIATAMVQLNQLGKMAAGMDAWIAKVEQRHDAGKLLADALIADSCAMLVGEEIRSHEDAATLIHGLDLLMRASGHAETGKDGRNLLPEGMNAQLLNAVFGGVKTSAGDLFDAANNGELDALLLVGSDPVGDGLFSRKAKAALEKVALIQVGAISGDMGNYAAVQLPAAAYSEVEGTFINMEGRVRVADNPISTLGEGRPMWKVMMRLLQSLGHEVPVVSLEEVRDKVLELAPSCAMLADVWSGAKDAKTIFVPSPRNKGAVYQPNVAEMNALKPVDVVARYSIYREGAWPRASALLTKAGAIHALDDVIVHPETLASLGLKEGMVTIVSSEGETQYNVGVRSDVSQGVVFVAKRGAAGDLSGNSSVELRGGL